MVPLLKQERTASSKRWLSGYCFLTLTATLVLLYAGGFTTTIGAGMVFPDWPLSNGSLNPPGWTTDQAMLAEHGHRLLGAVVGSLCLGLCLWMWRREERRWLRHLSYAALGLVIFQGLLGGARVLFVSLNLAKVHGITAQVFLCVLTAIAVGSSSWWQRLRAPAAGEAQRRWTVLRRTGLVICGLTMVQLLLGTILRHRGAGLSIPYFPHSAPDGSLLPVSWNWATMLHFSHRGVALLLTVVFLVWLAWLWQSGWVTMTVKRLAMAGAVLLLLQILLGAGIIWTARAPIQTTLHVLNGAIFLSLGWAVTFSFFKPKLEPSTQ